MNTIFFNVENKPVAAFAVVFLTEQKVNFKVSKNPGITLAESASGYVSMIFSHTYSPFL